MASIVSAGTTSATALNMSADTTGILQLASNNGTVALTINTSQNIGIGTSSPSCLFDVQKSAGANFVATFQNTTAATPYCVFIKDAVSSTAGYPLLAVTDSTGSSTYLRVDSSNGSVGIGGTPSASFKLRVANNSSTARNGILIENINGSGTPSGVIFQGYDWVRSAVWHDRSSGFPLQFAINPNTADLNVTGLAVAATFTNDGRFFVNTTTEPGSNDSAVAIKAGGTNKSRCLSLEAVTTASVIIQTFRNPNGQVGYVETDGSSTFYRTSSDYRLKDSVQPMTGALAKVALLKPVTYKWKVDGSSGQGFIAHELQEVVSEAVSGAKDGTEIQQYEISPAVPATYDEEGNELTPAVEAVMGEREVPAYQGIDTSFLVATLTAAIQELNAKVTDLEEQVLNLGVK
jgi:hypothetical protein